MKSSALWYVSGLLSGILLVACLWFVHWHERDSQWGVQGAARRQTHGVIFLVGHREPPLMNKQATTFEMLSAGDGKHDFVIVNCADALRAKDLQGKIYAIINGP